MDRWLLACVLLCVQTGGVLAFGESRLCPSGKHYTYPGPHTYTHAGNGQCYTESGPLPTSNSDINAAFPSYGTLSYSDKRYDTEANCIKLCESKPACAAYSWKQSYTDCQIFESDMPASNIVGIRERVKTLGHSDANCYTKDTVSVKSWPLPGSSIFSTESQARTCCPVPVEMHATDNA